MNRGFGICCGCHGSYEILLKYKVGAVIVSNTTEGNRENLMNILKHQKGGLSGKPLEEKSNKLIEFIDSEITIFENN